MAAAPQTLANHRRFVPAYHFVGTPLLVVYLLWALWALWTEPSVEAAMRLVLWGVVAVAFAYARLFPLKAQDRVIRLEERLRLERLAPEDLRGRSGELRTSQLIALRFASDGELPELARAALDEGLSPGAIKRRIRSWRADDERV